MTAPGTEGKKTKHHIGPWVGIVGIVVVIVLLMLFVIG
jgi:hypothetical protein